VKFLCVWFCFYTKTLYPRTLIHGIGTIDSNYKIKCKSYVFVFFDSKSKKLERITKSSVHCLTCPCLRILGWIMKKGKLWCFGWEGFSSSREQGFDMSSFWIIESWDVICWMDKNDEQGESDLNSPIKCHQGSLKVVFVLRI
jgi:hypothetical protein